MRIFLFLSLLLFSTVFNLTGQTSTKLTLADIYDSDKFESETLEEAKWFSNSEGFAFLKGEAENKSLYMHQIKSGNEIVLLDAKKMIDPETGEVFVLHDYSLSESGNKILLKTDAKRVWRKYSKARFLVYDRNNDKIIKVSAGRDFIFHAKISPDENRVAYVQQNNIYIKDLNSGQTIQATNDGSDDIINGRFDWVYEEEFGQDDGWRWSPDGKKIAFWRMDQSQIPTFSWVDYDSKYGKVHTIHYPKAGEKNALVQIGIYDLEKKSTVWLDLGDEEDIYIPRIQWTTDADLLSVQRMNRRQNNLDLLIYDTLSGKGRVILSEKDPCWVDIEDNLIFLSDEKQFVWTSERDGYNHIYLFDMDGRMIKQLTNGQWEVTDVFAINEKASKVYFSANRERTEEREIYSVSTNDHKIKKISNFQGISDAEFSPDTKYFIHIYSSSSNPEKVDLCNGDGKLVRALMENPMTELEKYNLAYPEFIKFETSDGAEIRAQITKPADFDPTKKYPVLIYGYGGPTSQLVKNSWGRMTSRLWYSLLAQKGYIIFTLDNRGTGGQGKAYKNLAYGDIGKYMVIDHIEGAKYLSTLPYIDKNRIGIWGWSGGGYLTLLCMARGSEYFKAGVAVAPVTDYHLYDSIWTERYMGLPQDNPAGYKAASALTYTDQYKDGLLIVHGTADDNVHAQNTMQFIEKLQLNNKPFQMMMYPQKNHSMRGGEPVNLHLYTMITDFILDNL